MKTLVPVLACTLLVAAGFASVKSADESAPKGKLVIVGGGGTTEEIIGRALQLAGGKDAHMLVVPQAAEDEKKSGVDSKQFWMEKGATHVEVLDPSDEKGALALVAQADFIWMPGGDQVRIIERLGKTGIPAAIRKRYQDGAVVGGTSAGAAVMSTVMVIGGEKADLKSVRSGGTETMDGLGLWPQVIVDQHFVKRQRFTRLLACVLDHPDLVGVGIDEKTAVIVDGGKCEVMGESTVLVLDARAAQKRASKAGETLSASGLQLNVLHQGDKFEIKPVAR
jgi:cyanophycinase